MTDEDMEHVRWTLTKSDHSLTEAAQCRLYDHAVALAAEVRRLRAAIEDALPYIPDHIPRTTLQAALADQPRDQPTEAI